jgi:hypothetical protein
MVQHGMGAFVGGGSEKPVNEDINTAGVWSKAVNGFLHCP